MRALAYRSAISVALLWAALPAFAQESPEPLELGTVEKETVRLVLLDVMVLDRQDRPVSGLTADDFDIVAAGKRVEVDTLDVRCDDAADPTRLADTPSRIVLALDYLHLNQMQLADVFERARDMIRADGIEGAEVMLAALNGGLRIEQKFTSDKKELLRSLKRMEYDVTLWNGMHHHLSETGFVGGVTTLLDVLGTVPDSKAIVLFSAMRDVPLDLEFRNIAAVASSSRCFIYPVDVTGFRGGKLGAIPGATRDAAPG